MMMMMQLKCTTLLFIAYLSSFAVIQLSGVTAVNSDQIPCDQMCVSR